MPQECMRERQFLMASPFSTSSPVSGQMPPLAKVEAITAPDSQVTSIEHSYKHICTSVEGLQFNFKH